MSLTDFWRLKNLGFKVCSGARNLIGYAYILRLRGRTMVSGTLKFSKLLGLSLYWRSRSLLSRVKTVAKTFFYTYLFKYKVFKILRSWSRSLASLLFKLKTMLMHGVKARDYSMLSRSAFVDAGRLSSRTFFEGGTLEVKGPNFIGSYDFVPIGEPRVLLEQPKLEASYYKSSVVMGGTNYTIVDQQVIHPDLYMPSRDVCPAELNGIAKLDLRKNTMSLYTGAVRDVKEAVSLLGCCTGNYAHWLTETLPKLLIVDSLDEFDGYPLLVDSWIHPNFIDSINLVKKKDRALIRVRRWEAVRVERLIDISPTAYVPPEYRVFHEQEKLSYPDSSDFPFSKAALGLLKGRALQALKINVSGEKRKLFLHRSKESCGNTRYVRNIEEIESLVRGYGYTFLDPASLSFNEQVSVFASASHIVSPLGAALANLIFAPEGCKVLGLSPYYEYANYYYFSNFMGVLGHELSYVLGRQVSERGHLLHRDYEVDLTALKLALDLMNSD